MNARSHAPFCVVRFEKTWRWRSIASLHAIRPPSLTDHFVLLDWRLTPRKASHVLQHTVLYYRTVNDRFESVEGCRQK